MMSDAIDEGVFPAEKKWKRELCRRMATLPLGKAGRRDFRNADELAVFLFSHSHIVKFSLVVKLASTKTGSSGTNKVP
jgi:hypothetical protein